MRWGSNAGHQGGRANVLDEVDGDDGFDAKVGCCEQGCGTDGTQAVHGERRAGLGLEQVDHSSRTANRHHNLKRSANRTLAPPSSSSPPTHPVCSPHPNGASIFRSVPSSTLTQLDSITTACRANALCPKKVAAMPPPSSALAAGSVPTSLFLNRPKLCSVQVAQAAGWPSAQWAHAVHELNERRTESPGLTRVTAEPMARTVPAPSWPAMVGKGEGKAPVGGAEQDQRPERRAGGEGRGGGEVGRGR